jgi:hypothetical protein
VAASFAQQLEFLRSHPDVVAIGGRVVSIDSEGDPLYPWDLPLTHDEIDAEHLIGRGGQLVHPAMMIRSQSLVNAGGYRTAFEPAEDLDLWLRLAEVGRLANIPQPVLYYRDHALMVSRAKRELQTAQAQRAISEARGRRGLPAFALAARPQPPPRQIWRDNFWHSWGAGNHHTSRKYARRMVRQNPLSPESWALLVRAFCAGPAKQLLRHVLSRS